MQQALCWCWNVFGTGSARRVGLDKRAEQRRRGLHVEWDWERKRGLRPGLFFDCEIASRGATASAAKVENAVMVQMAAVPRP